MIPLWLKVAYSAFVLVLIPFYWRSYGPANFLWFSDIALLLIAVALWTENRMIASMMAVAVLLPELVWNLVFFGRLLTGYRFAGLIGYMFNPDIPLYLRGLSLFHVFMPILLVWMVRRLGYDRRALKATALLAWVVLPLSYLLTEEEDNINWVFGIGKPQKVLHPLAFLALMMILIPLMMYLPTHLILRALFS